MTAIHQIARAILSALQGMLAGRGTGAAEGDSMMTVEELAREIVEREGGLVNDPDDPGGLTKYGVTLETVKRLAWDVNGDGRVDGADVIALTKEDAARLFVAEYYERPRIGLLPEALQAPVMDMQVHSGSNAGKILQRLLGRLGAPVSVDGAIGPETATASAVVAGKIGADALRDAYGSARRDYYYGVGDARPQSRKYVRRQSDGGKGGWIKRAEVFMAPAARLTEAQHRARVSKWT